MEHTMSLFFRPWTFCIDGIDTIPTGIYNDCRQMIVLIYVSFSEYEG